LVYLGCSFFIFILANHLSINEVNKYSTVTYIAETFKNILFCIAMIMYARQPKETASEKSIPYLDLTL
jgi:hypothetical protein